MTSRLPSLSTYMGHVSSVATYWYLPGSPTLVKLTADHIQNTVLRTQAILDCTVTLASQVEPPSKEGS